MAHSAWLPGGASGGLACTGAPRRRGPRARRAVAADGLPTGIVPRLEEASEAFFADLRRLASALAKRPARDRHGVEEHGLIARVREAAVVEDRLRAPLLELEEALEERSARAGPADALALGSLAARARDLRERLALFLEQRAPDAVYWVECAARRRSAALHVAPIEVAHVLRPCLFEDGRRVILTSATLAAAGSFAHLRRRLGIASASEAILGSPYDFEQQALLYLPEAIPDPGTDADGFADAVIDECRRLLRASRGGAFVLFTSYALLRRAHEALSRDASLRQLDLLRQDPGQGSSILE